MSTAPDDAASEENSGSPRLALLLSAAMFVLVVDTSLMNVSISAVVHDLHTTVSGVQSAIALEAWLEPVPHDANGTPIACMAVKPTRVMGWPACGT